MSQIEQLVSIYSENVEKIMAEHREAMACRDVETTLGLGILLFDNIRSRHQEWFADVQAKKQPYNINDAKGFADEYCTWKNATESWLRLVEQFEERGFSVEYANKIRSRYQDLSLIDLDVEAVSRSFENLEAGGGKDLDQFFDELQDSNS